MWHLYSPLAAAGRFHLWVAICICSWLFAFVAIIFICLHSCLVIYIHGWSFTFLAGRLHLWLVIYIHGWSFTFVAGHLHS